MKTIVEALEEQIPHGDHCDRKCPYLLEKGTFCDLMEEYVTRKECGINEEESDVRSRTPSTSPKRG